MEYFAGPGVHLDIVGLAIVASDLDAVDHEAVFGLEIGLLHGPRHSLQSGPLGGGLVYLGEAAELVALRSLSLVFSGLVLLVLGLALLLGSLDRARVGGLLFFLLGLVLLGRRVRPGGSRGASAQGQGGGRGRSYEELLRIHQNQSFHRSVTIFSSRARFCYIRGLLPRKFPAAHEVSYGNLRTS